MAIQDAGNKYRVNQSVSPDIRIYSSIGEGIRYSRCEVIHHYSNSTPGGSTPDNATMYSSECRRWVFDTSEFDNTFVTQVSDVTFVTHVGYVTFVTQIGGMALCLFHDKLSCCYEKKYNLCVSCLLFKVRSSLLHSSGVFAIVVLGLFLRDSSLFKWRAPPFSKGR